MTFAEQIEEAAKGPIEAIVLNHTRDYGGDEDTWAYRRGAKLIQKKLLSWGEARPMLDYEYDQGYGGEDCDAVWAWTKDRIVFVSLYDGATDVESIPRNPSDGTPQMYGGG